MVLLYLMFIKLFYRNVNINNKINGYSQMAGLWLDLWEIIKGILNEFLPF